MKQDSAGAVLSWPGKIPFDLKFGATYYAVARVRFGECETCNICNGAGEVTLGADGGCCGEIFDCPKCGGDGKAVLKSHLEYCVEELEIYGLETSEDDVKASFSAEDFEFAVTFHKQRGITCSQIRDIPYLHEWDGCPVTDSHEVAEATCAQLQAEGVGASKV